MSELISKLGDLVALITAQTKTRCNDQGLTYEGIERRWDVRIKPGKKYIKVDKDKSAFLMIDKSSRQIYGCKGYGVVNLRHQYGTLDTINNFNWGDHSPVRKGA